MRKLFLILSTTLLLLCFSRGVHAQDFITGSLTAQAAACPTNPGRSSSTSALTISAINAGGVTFTIGSTAFSGTVTFYGSGDGGTTWQPLNVFPSNSTTAVTTATTTGIWQANVAGYTHVCLLATTYSSGTITATIRTSAISARAGPGGGSGSGCGTAPTTPANVPQPCVVTPPSTTFGAALPGVVPNVQSGANYAFAATDRVKLVILNNAGAQIPTLPQAGSGGGTNADFTSNFPVKVCNQGAGTQTITPTTSTFTVFKGSGVPLTAQPTLVVNQGECYSIYSDNTNYIATFDVNSSGGGTAYCGAGIIDTTVACASDDFISDFSGTGTNIGQLGWGASGSACTTANYLQAALPHPGQYKCATSTTSGNIAELDLSQQNQAFGAMNTVAGWEFRFIVQLSTVSTVAYRFGLAIAGTGDPTSNGIWIRFDTGAADTTWTYETRSASTSTTSTTNAQTPTAGTDWWTIRIRSTSAGTVLFSTAKNGGAFTTETSIATNVPSAFLTPIMEVVTRTTAAAFFVVDWFSYLVTGLAR